MSEFLYPYNRDKLLWIAANLTIIENALKQSILPEEVDWKNLIEFMADIAASQIHVGRKLATQILVLRINKLIGKSQPSSTDLESQLEAALKESPSLHNALNEEIEDIYLEAINYIKQNSGFDEIIFKDNCPFSCIEEFVDRKQFIKKIVQYSNKLLKMQAY